jgi:hypothetical protein
VSSFLSSFGVTGRGLFRSPVPLSKLLHVKVGSEHGRYSFVAANFVLGSTPIFRKIGRRNQVSYELQTM